MPVNAILFDLDGTLIDSAPDLATSVNAVLAPEGLGPLPVEAVRDMIGDGVRALVERAFAASGRPLTDPELDDHEAAMMVVYAHNLTTGTLLYPGVREAIEYGREQGIKLAVVTNKPQAATRAILDHFGIADAFGAIIGGDQGIPRKPAPDPLWAALNALGVERERAVMVGDSIADVTAARAAGIGIVAVAGGYSATPASELGADCDIASLVELENALDTWR